MRYSVYILYSPSLNIFYKGQTNDIVDRLKRHNTGTEYTTAKGIPWQLIWSTHKETRIEAVALESKLKNLSKTKLILFMMKYKEGIAGNDAFLLLQKWSLC